MSRRPGSCWWRLSESSAWRKRTTSSAASLKSPFVRCWFDDLRCRRRGGTTSVGRSDARLGILTIIAGAQRQRCRHRDQPTEAPDDRARQRTMRRIHFFHHMATKSVSGSNGNPIASRNACSRSSRLMLGFSRMISLPYFYAPLPFAPRSSWPTFPEIRRSALAAVHPSPDQPMPICLSNHH